MNNITLGADESLIDAARAWAAAEKTTLNEQFRRWLADYARSCERMQRYDEAMKGLRGKFKVGRKPSREQANERSGLSGYQLAPTVALPLATR